MQNICKSCGTVIEENELACKYCGEPLSEHELIKSLQSDWENDLQQYNIDESSDKSIQTKRVKKTKGSKEDKYKQTYNKTVLIPTVSLVIIVSIIFGIVLYLNEQHNSYIETTIENNTKQNELTSETLDNNSIDKDSLIKQAEEGEVFNIVEELYGVDVGQAAEDFIDTIDGIGNGSGENKVKERLKAEFIQSCVFTSNFDNIVDNQSIWNTKNIKCLVKNDGSANGNKLNAIFLDDTDITFSQVMPDVRKKLIMDIDEIDGIFGTYNMIYGSITDIIGSGNEYTLYITVKYIESINEEEIIDNYN